jgi:hypothetical protein
MEGAPDPGQLLDLKTLIKSLAPDELGKFEPMSGLMLLNLSSAEFAEASVRFTAGKVNEDDIELMKIINHETYHFIQTGASGYVFDRQYQLLSRFKTSLQSAPDPAQDPELKASITMMRTSAGDDPDLKLRVDRTEAALIVLKKLELQNARALPGDHSAIGALVPEFFRHMDEMAEREAVPNADGLSIRGMLEGSAVAWAHQVMCPNGDVRAEMEAELATLEPVYRELYALTTGQVGDRAVELMLPAVALALCYGAPHNAYKPMISTLAAVPPEGVLECGRRIAADLPALPQAGAILGTSNQVRRGNDYPIYDSFIQDLESRRWGVDFYAVLAEPSALGRMGAFPVAIVTTDSFHFGSGVTRDHMLARLLMMSVALRVASRKRDELRGLQYLEAWVRDVMAWQRT